MATAERLNAPTYRLELTEDEATTLFTVVNTMICGSSEPGMPRAHTDSISDALAGVGVEYDKRIRKSWSGSNLCIGRGEDG